MNNIGNKNNVWQVANINGYKVKYCFTDRHYYLLSPAGNAWERMTLKTIAFLTGAEATFISHEVKHGKVYEPWQEYKERNQPTVETANKKTARQWDTLLKAIQGASHSLRLAVSRFTQTNIRHRLAYLISQAWYVGRCLGLPDVEITRHLEAVNSAS